MFPTIPATFSNISCFARTIAIRCPFDKAGFDELREHVFDFGGAQRTTDMHLDITDLQYSTLLNKHENFIAPGPTFVFRRVTHCSVSQCQASGPRDADSPIDIIAIDFSAVAPAPCGANSR